MSISVGDLRGVRSGRAQIDHRLERRALIIEYRKGRLRQDQVCDAHPELIRAAKNVGTPTDTPCPICDERELKLVTYVFGRRLPAHGRCVSSAEEMRALNRRRDELTAYVVEACVLVPLAPPAQGAPCRSLTGRLAPSSARSPARVLGLASRPPVPLGAGEPLDHRDLHPPLVDQPLALDPAELVDVAQGQQLSGPVGPLVPRRAPRRLPRRGPRRPRSCGDRPGGGFGERPPARERSDRGWRPDRSPARPGRARSRCARPRRTTGRPRRCRRRRGGRSSGRGRR